MKTTNCDPMINTDKKGTKTLISITLLIVALAFTTDMLKAQCTSPTVPTLGATFSTPCVGQSTTLSIVTGTLNSATAWKWYSGSPGGTSAGSGTSIIVAPGATTTYY